MIRLLILTDSNVGGAGGAEQHLSTLVSRMDYSRFEVDIIQMGAFGVPQAEGTISGASFSLVPLGKLASLAGLRALLKVMARMKRGRYDCILSYFETADLIAALLSPVLGIPACISSRRDTGFRHSKTIRRAYRLINHRFHSLIVPSKAVRQSLLDEGVRPELIRPIRNGVDMERFSHPPTNAIRTQLQIADDALLVGMVANLSPVKNHSTVVDAIHRLYESGLNIHLVLAGDGILRDELVSRAKQHGIEDRVHFLGLYHDIPGLLSAIDIFVLASKTEGLSNALLEAMASGKAVVATRVGGNPEVVAEGTGILIEPDNVEQLCEEIAGLAKSESTRQALGRRAQEHVARQFSINHMVAEYMDTIEQAVKA